MTKKPNVLRRTERVFALVVSLALATVAGAASGGDHPSKDSSSKDRQRTVELRGTVAGADRLAPSSASLIVPAGLPQPSSSDAAATRLALEQRCLAEAMYYEARGEGLEGEEAVAEVVFHRLHRRGYPSSICGIVYQGSNDGTGCQFSFVCNGEMDKPKDPAAWRYAGELAARILGGYLELGNSTDGAIAFHTVDVDPDWSSSLEPTVQIGNHIFYRPVPRTRAS